MPAEPQKQFRQHGAAAAQEVRTMRVRVVWAAVHAFCAAISAIVAWYFHESSALFVFAAGGVCADELRRAWGHLFPRGVLVAVSAGLGISHGKPQEPA